MTDWRGIPHEYRNAIVAGDARELAKRLPDESVDLIFTDPPYVKEQMELYDWLAKEASRILKPEGFVLAYTGTYWKFDVMKRMAKELEFFFDYIALDRQATIVLWAKRTVSKYKSILAFRKNGGMPRCNVLGVWMGSGPSKMYHEWGQDESTARYYIDCFSKPDDIVLDPFCGGGTTPVVCKYLERNYVAFEIDPETADIARKRVRETQPPLFIPQPQQAEMEL